jgi:phosphoserine phosphatase
MENNIVVFDFDKTLTYKDTLLGFYIHTSKKNFKFPIKLFYYFFNMILFKFNIISNDYLKIKGFNLFLKGLSISYIQNKAKSYVSKIEFNKLYKKFNFKNKNKKILILSASYDFYLRYAFPSNVYVFGSNFSSINGIASEFNLNCYSTNKKIILEKNGINTIETFYTDSYSDQSLAEISKHIIIVYKDKLIKCKHVDEFNSYFKK